jgi:hypothetical protein
MNTIRAFPQVGDSLDPAAGQLEVGDRTGPEHAEAVHALGRAVHEPVVGQRRRGDEEYVLPLQPLPHRGRDFLILLAHATPLSAPRIGSSRIPPRPVNLPIAFAARSTTRRRPARGAPDAGVIVVAGTPGGATIAAVCSEVSSRMSCSCRPRASCFCSRQDTVAILSRTVASGELTRFADGLTRLACVVRLPPSVALRFVGQGSAGPFRKIRRIVSARAFSLGCAEPIAAPGVPVSIRWHRSGAAPR